ncbi:hypothetical protein HYQ46_005709 [Verticillium longisporum]|nr:hypothetical protein HYQ46_005709 [Verticillium longisporum]
MVGLQVLKHDGTIVDGRNRVRVVRAIDYLPKLKGVLRIRQSALAIASLRLQQARRLAGLASVGASVLSVLENKYSLACNWRPSLREISLRV